VTGRFSSRASSNNDRVLIILLENCFLHASGRSETTAKWSLPCSFRHEKRSSIREHAAIWSMPHSPGCSVAEMNRVHQRFQTILARQWMAETPLCQAGLASTMCCFSFSLELFSYNPKRWFDRLHGATRMSPRRPRASTRRTKWGRTCRRRSASARLQARRSAPSCSIDWFPSSAVRSGNDHANSQLKRSNRGMFAVLQAFWC
jgi:hypothetical protein